jgi:hypothetical protein
VPYLFQNPFRSNGSWFLVRVTILRREAAAAVSAALLHIADAVARPAWRYRWLRRQATVCLAITGGETFLFTTLAIRADVSADLR